MWNWHISCLVAGLALYNHVRGGARKKKTKTKAATYINFHMFIKSVIHNKTMSHAYPVRFHGMASAISIVPDIGYSMLVELNVLLDCTYSRKSKRHLDKKVC